VCALELALVPLPGARKLFQGVVVRMVYVPFGAGLLVPLLNVLLRGGVCYGAVLLVPLRGDVAGCCCHRLCALWSWFAGATARCCFSGV